jgi:thymidylate kinase
MPMKWCITAGISPVNMACVPETWIPALFIAWRERGIRFAVLRNYANLPKDIGNDLDVLVDAERIREAESALHQVLAPLGGRVHHRAEFSPLSLFFHDTATRKQYHLDLFRDLKWRGFDILPAEDVLERVRDVNGIPAPNEVDEAILNFLTRLLYAGYVRDKYKPAIALAFRADEANVGERLRGILGPIGVEIVRAVQYERWGDIERQVGLIRRRLVLRALRQPVRVLEALRADARRLAARAWKVPGIVVVLTGPDGCGKTSVGERLKQRLAGTFYAGFTTYIHWKPRLLGYKATQSTPFGAPCTDPHGKPKRGPIRNALYFIAHSLEIPPAWWLRVRPRLFRNMLVMIDRYYFDFMVDPRRYRLSVTEKWAWFMYRFMPKPDLVVCLTAPAVVIQQRKKEVPLEETERQRKAYEAVVSRLPNGHVIDTDRPLDKVVDEVEAVVLEYVSLRLEATFLH